MLSVKSGPLEARRHWRRIDMHDQEPMIDYRKCKTPNEGTNCSGGKCKTGKWGSPFSKKLRHKINTRWWTHDIFFYEPQQIRVRYHRAKSSLDNYYSYRNTEVVARLCTEHVDTGQLKSLCSRAATHDSSNLMSASWHRVLKDMRSCKALIGVVGSILDCFGLTLRATLYRLMGLHCRCWSNAGCPNKHTSQVSVASSASNELTPSPADSHHSWLTLSVRSADVSSLQRLTALRNYKCTFMRSTMETHAYRL